MAIVSPLRHISCYRLIRHNHRAACLRNLAHLAIEILNGTDKVLYAVGLYRKYFKDIREAIL